MIYDLTASARRNHHKVSLNREFKEELSWGVDFAGVFNGQASIILTSFFVLPVLSVLHVLYEHGVNVEHGKHE